MPIYLQKPNGVTYKVKRSCNIDDMLYVCPIGVKSKAEPQHGDYGEILYSFIPNSFYLSTKPFSEYHRGGFDWTV